jgi:hypothetical protein
MKIRKCDEAREHRVENEIIVDAYAPEEQAMGWYGHLDGHIKFPFRAVCIRARDVSPLKKGETVMVTRMARESECMHEMFVRVKWQGRAFAVPLAQLEPQGVDPRTAQAVADWHYWVNSGYALS